MMRALAGIAVAVLIVAKVAPGTTIAKPGQCCGRICCPSASSSSSTKPDVPAPAYLLTVANGKPNLGPSTSEERGSCQPPPQANSATGSVPPIVLECRDAGMEA
jgi:hypothetical protein